MRIIQKSLRILAVFTMLASASLFAASQAVEYKQGDTALDGYLAWPDNPSAPKLPAVLVVHDWMGNGDFSKKRADDLAKLGYVAFACDIYGKGVRPANREEAAAQAGKFKSNRELLRERAQAGLDVLKNHKMVDASKIGVMGYCFGGTTSLELARSGAEIVGAVSFHGGLDTPNPGDAKKIKGKILVLHGADDPFVPPAQVAAFQDEMRNAKVDWQFVGYGGSVHSFTNPAAGNDNSKGAAYNESANKRSWEAMKNFWVEVFGK